MTVSVHRTTVGDPRGQECHLCPFALLLPDAACDRDFGRFLKTFNAALVGMMVRTGLPKVALPQSYGSSGAENKPIT